MRDQPENRQGARYRDSTVDFRSRRPVDARGNSPFSESGAGGHQPVARRAVGGQDGSGSSRWCHRRGSPARGDDAVFLPAEDGGYVLIGLRQPLPVLFDGIAWGTGCVTEATRIRLRAIGATWREPKVLWDVDRPADLPRLDALWRDEAQRSARWVRGG
ncbi:MAG: DUF2064 domain-containing protein [Betaproteobacteria bacterium]|nr:DUF2064 domain-containing protein [Betaproteobacteria bacterium]